MPIKKLKIETGTILVLAVFLSPRSILDPFASIPFPRLYEVVVFLIFAKFAVKQHKFLSLNRLIITSIVVCYFIFQLMFFASYRFAEFLPYAKLLEVFIITILLIRSDLKFNSIQKIMKFVLLINLIFLAYQVVSGNYLGVERAFEKRGATFIEPAIGASGFTMGVLVLYFYFSKSYIFATLAMCGVLLTGSGAAFAFTTFIILIMAVFSFHKSIVYNLFLAVSVVILYFTVQYFSEVRFAENIMRRTSTVIDIMQNGTFHLLGNRWLNWQDAYMSTEIALFGNGFGYMGVIDNLYLKFIADVGVLPTILLYGIIILICFCKRHDSLLFACTILIICMSLSHDILMAVRVMEIYSICILMAYSQNSNRRKYDE